jgi:hypothetical protein
MAMGLLLWSGTSIPALALICYGAGNGIWSISRGTVPMALFAPPGYAVLMGKLVTPVLMAQALAPSFGAMLIDRMGTSSTLAWLSALALLNVIGVAVLALKTWGRG